MNIRWNYIILLYPILEDIREWNKAIVVSIDMNSPGGYDFFFNFNFIMLR